MKLSLLGCLMLLGSALLFGSQETEINVNARYTVEGVLITGDGWTTDVVSDSGDKLNKSLRRELMSLIGEKLNPSVLDDLAKRLRKEFHARAVTHRILRGASPEYVRVVFEMQFRPTRFDVSVPKFLYQGKQGWSGEIDGTVSVKQNGFTFGLVSDGDELAERYAGLLARYENARLGTDRLKMRFQFESYHTQWNRSTLESLGSVHAGQSGDWSGIYRTRQNFQPTLTVVIAKPLTLSFGASFQRFQSQYPEARTEAANSVLASLRFQRRLEGEVRQDVEAGYNLRAATKTLNTDFVYARHRWHLRYSLSRGRHTLMDEAIGGMVGGRAPLFERFVLGNSSTLRGWNKWDLDPLGGNRMVHNSVEYRYGVFQVFYDAGAIWDNGQNATPRHSIGVGLRHGSFSLAVAFPLRDGRVEPIFMVGMNY
jgi:hypothetical protein